VDAAAAVARNAFWGGRGVCGGSGPKTHFGVNATAAAVAAMTAGCGVTVPSDTSQHGGITYHYKHR